MLKSILGLWDASITSLQFVERYGSLVRRMPIDVPTNEGTVKKYYPVSCSVSAKDCLENGKYMDLVPDSRYKSVVYWEDLTGIAFLPGVRKHTFVGTATVRLVCWLNLKALGIDSCDGLDGMIISAIAQSDHINSMSTPFKAAGISLKVDGVESRSLDVFSDYSYQDNEEMFFFPYDFFAIRYDVQFTIGKDCLPDLTIDPITCITV